MSSYLTLNFSSGFISGYQYQGPEKWFRSLYAAHSSLIPGTAWYPPNFIWSDPLSPEPGITTEHTRCAPPKKNNNSNNKLSEVENVYLFPWRLFQWSRFLSDCRGAHSTVSSGPRSAESSWHLGGLVTVCNKKCSAAYPHFHILKHEWRSSKGSLGSASEWTVCHSESTLMPILLLMQSSLDSGSSFPSSSPPTSFRWASLVESHSPAWNIATISTATCSTWCFGSESYRRIALWAERLHTGKVLTLHITKLGSIPSTTKDLLSTQEWSLSQPWAQLNMPLSREKEKKKKSIALIAVTSKKPHSKIKQNPLPMESTVPRLGQVARSLWPGAVITRDPKTLLGCGQCIGKNEGLESRAVSLPAFNLALLKHSWTCWCKGLLPHVAGTSRV